MTTGGSGVGGGGVCAMICDDEIDSAAIAMALAALRRVLPLISLSKTTPSFGVPVPGG
jgi:hypothetical protein